MPINSPDIFNSVGDATVTGGSGVGTVTEVDAGTGLATTPASGIVTTGSIKIDDTGVSAGVYKTDIGGSLTINAQGQVTSATTGAEYQRVEVGISPTILNGNYVTLVTGQTGKLFVPSNVMAICTAGSGSEGQKTEVGIFYDGANNTTQPFMSCSVGMFGISTGDVRTCMARLSTSFLMTSSAVGKTVNMTTYGTNYSGNWTGKLVITGVFIDV